ncbi:twin-arginine translocase subunit TatC [Clostridium formicaceticum]|uniref:Sec-independent protein translocase protein TatC n=1 Tax=Clostridium formicaceticum TaxID=1497 RepID=A0AAC9RMI1_9CLOT|nr:twin-arginine translocase subunit TatC [Clostridium formicaceticum]AOY77744.1 twin arginine-targeting protein translocase TatC [Clostridium formicaceticum]ARE88342.1 Sec-independent protein translocase protein TatCy [Clostridium formicaceticum]
MIINYAKIIEPLERFRKVIIFSLIIVMVVMIVAYLRADVLIGFLAKPLGEKQLVFLSPIEGFMTKIQVAFFTALALSSPLIFWQAVGLAVPLLGRRQKKVLYWVIPLATLLFTVGVIFSFTVVIPITLKFLLKMGEAYMTATLAAGQYFSFVIMLSLGMGVVFELPVILAILATVGIINSRMLREKRKFAFLGIMVLAAFITPSDAFSMLAVGIPVFLLYEFSILMILVIEKSSKKHSNLQEV